MFKSIVLKVSYIGNQEEYYGKLLFVNGAVLLLSFILCITKDFYLSIFSHIFILLWISLITNNVVSLHKRHNAEFTWSLSIHSTLKRFLILINATFIHSGIFLLVTLVQFILFFKAEFHIAIITAILHYIYAIAIGVLIGIIIKNRLLSPAIIIIFYLLFFFFLGSSWPRIERYRMFSPSVQLLNMSMPLVTNIISLIAISIFIFICSYYILNKNPKSHFVKYVLIVFSFVLILIAPLCETKINGRFTTQEYQVVTTNNIKVIYRGINEDVANQYATMLMDVNTIWNKTYPGYQPIKKMKIQRYFIAPYLDTRMIPFSLEDQCLNINIFSDAMLNFNTPDLLYDLFTRMLKNSNGFPPGIQMAELIQQIAMTNRYGLDFVKYTNAICNKK